MALTGCNQDTGREGHGRSWENLALCWMSSHATFSMEADTRSRPAFGAYWRMLLLGALRAKRSPEIHPRGDTADRRRSGRARPPAPRGDTATPVPASCRWSGPLQRRTLLCSGKKVAGSLMGVVVDPLRRAAPAHVELACTAPLPAAPARVELAGTALLPVAPRLTA
jgi:hypothetical protein